MGDTNYIGTIVKILEIPKQTIVQNNISLAQFRVQFPQSFKVRIVKLKVWGNLAIDVAKYYNINDYILIEGYISLRQTPNITKQTSKKVEITVLKVYPFLLSKNSSISKI